MKRFMVAMTKWMTTGTVPTATQLDDEEYEEEEEEEEEPEAISVIEEVAEVEESEPEETTVSTAPPVAGEIGAAEESRQEGSDQDSETGSEESSARQEESCTG